jgi:hypothetical protein
VKLRYSFPSASLCHLARSQQAGDLSQRDVTEAGHLVAVRVGGAHLCH